MTTDPTKDPLDARVDELTAAGASLSRDVEDLAAALLPAAGDLSASATVTPA